MEEFPGFSAYFARLNTNCLEHLFFAAYLILFSWLVTIVPFLKKSGLTAPQLIIFFLIKIIAGIFYGWIGVYYGELAQMVDTWAYHYEGIKAYELLKIDRSAYWQSLFGNNYGGYGNFFLSDNSWWNDLHSNAFIMLLSLFDFLSFGNYYINVVFYSFITFFGSIGLYRVMADVFPEKKQLVLFTTFLLPSFIYWTSGVHKDGLVFLAFMLIIYNVYFGLKESQIFKRSILIVLGLVLLLILRNFLLVIFLPALVAWIIAFKGNKNPLLIFSSVYAISIFLFFAMRYVSPSLNFPQAVVEKQKSFLSLKGDSPVPVTVLKPSPSSFFKNLPQALSLTVLRPYPSDVKHLLSLASCLETYLLLIGFILFSVWRANRYPNAFLLFCLFFSFSVLLTIGYTVSFLGAIVRYRSIVLPFLVIPMVCFTNWQKVFNAVSRRY